MQMGHHAQTSTSSEESQLLEVSQVLSPDDDKGLESMKMQLNDVIEHLNFEREKNSLKKLKQILYRISKRKKSRELQCLGIQSLILYYLTLYYSQSNKTKKSIHYHEKCSKKLTQYLDAKYQKQKKEKNPIQSHHLRIKSIFINLLLFGSYHLAKEGMYEESYEKAMKAYEMLLDLFRNIYNEYPNEKINQQINADDQIYFGQILLDQSYPIIEDIIYYPNTEVSWENSYLLEIKSIISQWKLNPQHNVFQLAKRLKIREKSELKIEKRNILGVKDLKQQSESPQFRISEIVKLKSLTLDELMKADDLTFEVSQKNFKTKLEYLTLSIFFMAKGYLNIEHIRTSFLPFPIYPKNKTKKSQYFHLKAIQTAIKYLQQNKGLIFLIINSYHEHFRNSLRPISEQNTMIESSILNTPILMEKKKNPFYQKILEERTQSLYYQNTKKCIIKQEKQEKKKKKQKSSGKKEKKVKVDELSPQASGLSYWKRSQSTLQFPSVQSTSSRIKYSQISLKKFDRKTRKSRKTK